MGKEKQAHQDGQTPKDAPETAADDQEADVSGHSLLHEQLYRDTAARRSAEADRWAREQQRSGKTGSGEKASPRHRFSRINILAPTLGLLTLVILGVAGA